MSALHDLPPFDEMEDYLLIEGYRTGAPLALDPSVAYANRTQIEGVNCPNCISGHFEYRPFTRMTRNSGFPEYRKFGVCDTCGYWEER